MTPWRVIPLSITHKGNELRIKYFLALIGKQCDTAIAYCYNVSQINHLNKTTMGHRVHINSLGRVSRTSKKDRYEYLRDTATLRKKEIKDMHLEPKKHIFRATIKVAFTYVRFKGDSYPGKKIKIESSMVERIAALGFHIYYEEV